MAEHVMFLVEKAWTDSMENEVSAAFGYEPELIVATEEQANALVDEAGPFVTTCWAVRGPTPARRYHKLPARVATPPDLTLLRELAKRWCDNSDKADRYLSEGTRRPANDSIKAASKQEYRCASELTAALDEMEAK